VDLRRREHLPQWRIMNQNDLLIEPADRPTSRAQDSENGMRNATLRTSEIIDFDDQGARPNLRDARAQGAWAPESASHFTFVDTLPKNQFLRQLHLERRRTDRSKAPLSIVQFRLDSGYAAALERVEELLQLLRISKRETDTLGYLGEDVVALVLPDTNEHGAQAFVRKIVDQAEHLQLATTTATYPDQSLDSIAAGAEVLLGRGSASWGGGEAEQRKGYALKRALDVVGSILGIVLLSPLMLVTAVAIALTSRGPVIFRQTRLGAVGAPFVFYKFRSMSCNSDDRIHREYVAKLINGDLAQVNQGDGLRPLFKMKSDPRVTRIGKIIRKTSIDELPQLFNVLKGDMSLVGPRPPLPYEAEKYSSWHLRRVLEIKPGITGLWQVEGRSKTSFDEMVRLDLRYMKRCSLLLDLKILLKTIKVVLRCEGAN
jgi:exopolysaccharide biosynthesis polyprenyl glycosylphosphotransferase